MKRTRKLRLLARLDSAIADLREATAAIQRDDFDTSHEKFQSASSGLRAAADELRQAA